MIGLLQPIDLSVSHDAHCPFRLHEGGSTKEVIVEFLKALKKDGGFNSRHGGKISATDAAAIRKDERCLKG